MNVGKPHLFGSVGLLAAAVAYNVWVFTRPATTATAATARPAEVTNAEAVGTQAPAAPDLSQLEPLPDVALDRAPVWPRDPFFDSRPKPAPVSEPIAAAPVAPEAELVVATILHSADRRVAMVNGRIVRVGDSIGSAKVVDILPDAVVVDSPRGRRLLSVRPAGAVRQR